MVCPSLRWYNFPFPAPSLRLRPKWMLEQRSGPARLQHPCPESDTEREEPWPDGPPSPLALVPARLCRKKKLERESDKPDRLLLHETPGRARNSWIRVLALFPDSFTDSRQAGQPRIAGSSTVHRYIPCSQRLSARFRVRNTVQPHAGRDRFRNSGLQR